MTLQKTYQLPGEVIPLSHATSLAISHIGSLLLPAQVAVLDGMAVAPKEKVHAANMHGAAAEGLLAIRKKYFPRGELDDNGGTIPPPSAGLVAADAKEEASDP
eukprot:scaffold68988_cov18-Tisochrysis_lutea.AAC.1